MARNRRRALNPSSLLSEESFLRVNLLLGRGMRGELMLTLRQVKKGRSLNLPMIAMGMS